MAAWAHGLEREHGGHERSNSARLALRIKTQREYFALGKDFLERGIKNNPKTTAALRIARSPLQREISGSRARVRIFRESRGNTGRARVKRQTVFRFTSSPIAKAVSARPINVCASSTTSGENERLPTLITRLKFLETN